MADSEYLLIQCPHGHDLQAASGDLKKKLACPVCDVHFIPHETGRSDTASQADGVIEASSQAHLPTPPSPLTPPKSTFWKLVCLTLTLAFWVLNLVAIMSFGPNVKQLIGQNGPLAVVLSFFVCICLVAIPAGIVLNFVWINKIFGDMQRTKLIKTIAPIAAIAISLIPFLGNLILIDRLTAALRKQSDGRINPEYSRKARKSSVALHIASLIALIGMTTSGYYAGTILEKARDQYLAKVTEGGEPAQLADLSTEQRTKLNLTLAEAIPPSFHITFAIAPCLLGIVYGIAVRKTETAIYQPATPSMSQ